MTTEAAAQNYLLDHIASCKDRKRVIYNPNNVAPETLPVIYGFNNGGSIDWLDAQVIAEDGIFLGGHICSNEGYMPHDLGILEGCREDRHTEHYRPHYPQGYRMEFVGYLEYATHEKLRDAVKKANTPEEG